MFQKAFASRPTAGVSNTNANSTVNDLPQLALHVEKQCNRDVSFSGAIHHSHNVLEDTFPERLSVREGCGSRAPVSPAPFCSRQESGRVILIDFVSVPVWVRHHNSIFRPQKSNNARFAIQYEPKRRITVYSGAEEACRSQLGGLLEESVSISFQFRISRFFSLLVTNCIILIIRLTEVHMDRLRWFKGGGGRGVGVVRRGMGRWKINLVSIRPESNLRWYAFVRRAWNRLAVWREARLSHKQVIDLVIKGTKQLGWGWRLC